MNVMLESEDDLSTPLIALPINFFVGKALGTTLGILATGLSSPRLDLFLKQTTNPIRCFLNDIPDDQETCLVRL